MDGLSASLLSILDEKDIDMTENLSGSVDDEFSETKTNQDESSPKHSGFEDSEILQSSFQQSDSDLSGSKLPHCNVLPVEIVELILVKSITSSAQTVQTYQSLSNT